MMPNIAPSAAIRPNGNVLARTAETRITAGNQTIPLSGGGTVAFTESKVVVRADDGAILGTYLGAGAGASVDQSILSDGRIVVTRGTSTGSPFGFDVTVQIFGRDGVAQTGEIVVSASRSGEQTLGSQGSYRYGNEVVALKSGGFVAVWDDASGTASEVKAQFFTASGAKVGGEITVNTQQAGVQNLSQAATLANGNVLVMWSDQSLSGAPNRGQIFTADGVRAGDEIRLAGNATTKIATLADGGFAIVWDTDPSNEQPVRLQRYSSAGVAVGVTETVGSNSLYSDVIPLVGGGFVVLWTQFGVFAQVYAADGTRIGGQITLDASATGGTAYGPTSAKGVGLSDGGFAVSWGQRDALTLREYTATGQQIGTERFVSPDIAYGRPYELVALSDGGVLISYRVSPSATGAYDVVRIFGRPAYEALSDRPLDLKGTLAIADADGGGAVTAVTLRVATGTLAVTAGGSGATVTGDGSAVVTLSGTIGQINALLSTDVTSSVRYTAPGNATGETTITLEINDHGAGIPAGALNAQASATIAFNTNSAPVITPGTEAITVREDLGGRIIAPSATVRDLDDPVLVNLTVRITNGFQAGDLLWMSGYPAVYDATTGTLTFTPAVPGSQSDFTTYLRNVGFSTTSDSPGTSRSFEFMVSDGTASSAPAVRTITIVPVEDQPIVDTNGDGPGLVSYAYFGIGGAPVAVAPAAIAYDPDSVTPGYLRLRYGATVTTNQLTIANQGTAAGQVGISGSSVMYGGTAIGTFSGGLGGSGLQVDFNGAATFAAAQAVLRAIQYSSTAATASSDQATIYVTMTDDAGTVSSAMVGIYAFTRNVVITSNDGGDTVTISVRENESAVTTLTATSASVIQWQIINDPQAPDGGAFRLSGNQLTFAQAPNFEQPRDFNADNSYIVRVRASDGTVSDDQIITVKVADVVEGARQFSAAPWTSAVPPVGQSWQIGDFNGDGRADILRALAGQGVETLLSTGTAFSAGSIWSTVGQGTDGRWYVGDFNGDGRDDIFRYVEGTSGAQVYLSNGSAFALSGSWTGAGTGTDGRWYLGDFNGDGRTDILRYLVGTSGAQVLLSTGTGFALAGNWTGAGYGSDGRWTVGDFHGDGRSDLLRTTADGFLQVLISNGSSFVPTGNWVRGSTGVDDHFAVGDFNADGRDDLAFTTIDGTRIFESVGNAFVQSTTSIGLGAGPQGWFAGDFNGDGRWDLLRVSSTTDVLV